MVHPQLIFFDVQQFQPLAYGDDFCYTGWNKGSKCLDAGIIEKSFLEELDILNNKYYCSAPWVSEKSTTCDYQFSGHFPFQVHFPVLQKVLNKPALQASGPW
jgi:hypothetical protein